MSSPDYLPSMSVDEYLRHLSDHHPALHDLVDESRLLSDKVLAALAQTYTEFDSDTAGRGDSYRRAQRNPLVRWTGITALLGLVRGTQEDAVVLDVLGGDGTVVRAVHQSEAAASGTVITSDVSGPMIDAALRQGLPAVRQSADSLILRDGSVDGVLIAYGTHHIDPAARPWAADEAVRVVRQGGNVVIHDFDPASPMARFFAEFVHPGTAAGHDYVHVSREEMRDLFDQQPVRSTVHDLYDPLIVDGSTAEEARRAMCAYIGDMYGVTAMLDALPYGGWEAIEDVFDHTSYLAALDDPPHVRPRPSVRAEGGRFIAEVPRMALAIHARKEAS